MQTATIAADGTMVVEYYYDRLTYSVTLDANGGAFVTESTEEEPEEEPETETEGEGEPGTDSEETPVISQTLYFLYGEPLVLPTPERAGYGFTGWHKDNAEYTVGTMPADNITLSAQWEAGKIGYTVNHYQQNIDGSDNYTIANVDNFTADMDSNVTPDVKTYEGFTSPAAESITIQANAALNVINYYYTHNLYTLGWDLNGGTAENSYTSGEVYYGAPVTAPATEAVEAVDPVTAMPANAESYKAIWTANEYQVSFDLNGGTVVTAEGEEPVSTNTRIVAFDSAYGKLPVLEKNGYTFEGWYTDETAGTKVTAETILSIDANHTLYARFILIKNPIAYVFMDSNLKAEIGGVDNSDNPAYHSVEDHEFTLTAPEKAGYNFDGWYLSYDNGIFTEKVEGRIDFAAEAYYGKTFFAKFDPIPYTVVIYYGTGTGETESIPIYYGESFNLSEYSSYIANSRTGYTLLGWSLADDGTAEYSTTATVSDLTTAEGGTANLYAIWKLNVYSITYDMGMHTNETDADYVKSYSIETPADITLPAPAAKENFRFGGWYTNSGCTGTPITTIAVKNAGTNYTLYAKWEHGGTFSISYTNKTNGKANFTITRTIPDGAYASPEIQTVYVRTLNGTAYATTPEVASGTGQDKYHFTHNQAAIEFKAGDTNPKTFSVTEKDDKLEVYVTASYQIDGKQRNYYAEIYKVVSPSGGINGVIGTKRAERTMEKSSYKLVASGSNSPYYGGWGRVSIQSGEVEVNQNGYSSNTYYTVKPSSATFDSTWNDKYEAIACNNYKCFFGFKVREVDDCYEWARISFNGTKIAEYHFAYVHKSLETAWSDIPVYLPSNGTESQNVGKFVFSKDACKVEEYSPISGEYIYADANDVLKIEFASSGSEGSNKWKYKELRLSVQRLDKSEPEKQYVAPIALTEYKAGDKVMLTVIYDEAIDRISGTPSLNISSSKIGQYFKDPTYIKNGSGTNAIVFEVTVKDGVTISADTAMEINKYLAYKESNIGGTFGSNIGTMSATVWDILGN